MSDLQHPDQYSDNKPATEAPAPASQANQPTAEAGNSAPSAGQQPTASGRLANEPLEAVQAFPTRLPSWLKRPVGSGKAFTHVVELLKKERLATVCDSAACPNRGECFSKGTATFMIMGRVCTRNCAFCAVDHGTIEPLEADEPERLARAVKALALRHVVITSVTRDDLPDGGAEHFARVITAVRQQSPEVTIEVLTPDFKAQPGQMDVVIRARPDVFNHNVETTRRLTREIRSGADYDRSLAVLAYVAEANKRSASPPIVVKSGFMLGLGETDDEIDQLLSDLRAAGVTMLTIGQYLRPGPENRPVHRYIPPAEFSSLQQQAERLGFDYVAAGPFVRSSYFAEQGLSEMKQRQAASPAPSRAERFQFRLMIDPPLPGARNMAIDEAILQAVNDGQSPATLRFYQWSEPTISLGYFQTLDQQQQQLPRFRSLPVVRRQTGGGAILHDRELTYSLILPIDLPIASDIETMYRSVHDVFIDVLARWGVTATYRDTSDPQNSQRGPFFCFARNHRLDLVINGQKVLGSAQRRIRGAALQHGSLILDHDDTHQPGGALSDVLDTVPSPTEIAQQVAEQWARQVNAEDSPGSPQSHHSLSEWELTRVRQLEGGKYANDCWTRDRKVAR